MCWLAVDAPQVSLEGVPVYKKGFCAQLDADAQDTAMGAPILFLRRLQTNTIAVMQHVQQSALNTAS